MTLTALTNVQFIFNQPPFALGSLKSDQAVAHMVDFVKEVCGHTNFLPAQVIQTDDVVRFTILVNRVSVWNGLDFTLTALLFDLFDSLQLSGTHFEVSLQEVGEQSKGRGLTAFLTEAGGVAIQESCDTQQAARCITSEHIQQIQQRDAPSGYCGNVVPINRRLRKHPLFA